MTPDRLYVNGIFEDDGQPVIEDFSPQLAVEMARAASGELFDKDQESLLNVLNARDTPHMGPVAGVDARDLSQAGWSILFAEDDPDADAIQEAMKPLLELRKKQAGDRYKVYWKDERGRILGYKAEQSAEDWLEARDGSAFDDVDPRKVPYYILIVGSPERIPYRFQYELDLAYAVGRVHFDTIEEYEAYARAVRAAEDGAAKRDRRVAMFAPTNHRDFATQLSADYLAEPVADTFAAAYPGWTVDRMIGDGNGGEASGATKTNLMRALTDGSRPALLFTASHGLAYRDPQNPKMRERQGALVCQEWPGAGHRVEETACFSANDITHELQTDGLITFHFACYGAGTPVRDNFGQRRRIEDFKAGESLDARIAKEAFVARLPQRLLSRGGALAAVGHVERAYPDSFKSHGKNQFDSALKELADGYPIGHVLDRFNRRYTSLSTQLFGYLAGRPKPNSLKVAELFTATIDARNYVVVGDPAARLNVSPDPSVTPS